MQGSPALYRSRQPIGRWKASQEAYPSAPSPGAIVPTEAVDLAIALLPIVQGFIPLNIETKRSRRRLPSAALSFPATPNYLNWFVRDQRPSSTSQRPDQGDPTANPCKSSIPP